MGSGVMRKRSLVGKVILGSVLLGSLIGCGIACSLDRAERTVNAFATLLADTPSSAPRMALAWQAIGDAKASKEKAKAIP